MSTAAPPGPFGQIAQDQLGDLLDAVVDAAPIDSAVALRAAAAADVANQIADVITGSLEDHGCPRGSWEIHLLCGALAAVAQAMKAGEDLARTAVIEGVTAAAVAGGAPRPARRAGWSRRCGRADEAVADPAF